MRLRHSSSPMGSTGSSNESWPSSKDEDVEMYSHANAKHAKTSDDSGPDDVEEPNESWNEVRLRKSRHANLCSKNQFFMKTLSL